MPRKKLAKKTNRKVVRTTESRAVSFLIGVVTVALIALAIFGLAQGKNYKSVLGEQAPIQNSR